MVVRIKAPEEALRNGHQDMLRIRSNHEHIVERKRSSVVVDDEERGDPRL